MTYRLRFTREMLRYLHRTDGTATVRNRVIEPDETPGTGDVWITGIDWDTTSA